MTEPRKAGSNDRAAGPTVIFLNTGISDHIGPVRLWVDLSRQWAQQGLRSVRVDLSGLGFSPAQPGRPFDLAWPPEALDDMHDVAAAVSPDDPANVVFVGLCSGGYHAIEGGMALGARVCARKPGPGLEPADELDARAGDRRAPPGSTCPQALGPGAAGPRQTGSPVERMPSPVWWAVNRFAVEQSPARGCVRSLTEGSEPSS